MISNTLALLRAKVKPSVRTKSSTLGGKEPPRCTSCFGTGRQGHGECRKCQGTGYDQGSIKIAKTWERLHVPWNGGAKPCMTLDESLIIKARAPSCEQSKFWIKMYGLKPREKTKNLMCIDCGITLPPTNKKGLCATCEPARGVSKR